MKTLKIFCFAEKNKFKKAIPLVFQHYYYAIRPELSTPPVSETSGGMRDHGRRTEILLSNIG